MSNSSMYFVLCDRPGECSSEKNWRELGQEYFFPSLRQNRDSRTVLRTKTLSDA